MAHEIIKPLERLARPGALAMGAVLVGGLVEMGRAVNEKRQPDVADIKSYCEDDGPSFIFFRGCGENYQAQAPIHHRKLNGYGSLHFEYQVEGRHSQELIDQSVIKACKLDGDRDRVFIGTSMGLMNAMRSLTNPAVRDAVGENRLKAIISRSGITSRADLQPGMQRAANLSAHTPPLPVVGDFWRAHRLRRAHRHLAHSPNTSLEEARMHHESSAYMPFRLVASQHRAIYGSEPWQPGSHSAITEENPDLRLYAITAEYDDVANWKETESSLKKSFGLPVETTIDDRRPRGSHADDLEFIEPLAERMALLSRRHSKMFEAATSLETYSWRPELASAS